MKIWQKKEGQTPDNLVDLFTVGRDKEFDIVLAEYDVMGSIAHAKMLGKVGLLGATELKEVVQGLEEILLDIRKGVFIINDDAEDVHSQVEYLLTQKIGDAGKKIHSGRSRNDQVALDIKLYLRAKIGEISKELKSLFDLLISKSNTYKDSGLHGYTLLQLAMPSSFGLWFGAYAESFVDDMEMIVGALKIINRNPLGSGAGYGSTFPLDRQMTTDLLGFETLNWNAVNAQTGRGKGEKAMASGMSFIAATLARLSMDCCLYMNEHFGFISFPEHLTTGSSIMPHKRNPDVFELIRGKCNRIQSLPNELNLLCANLPSGYHREMQLTKEILFPAIDELIFCIKMAHLMIANIKIKEDILTDKKYTYLFTVDAVNQLVTSGVPFRDAYKIIGNQVADGTFNFSAEKAEIPTHPHEGSVYRLCNDEIIAEMEKVMMKLKISS
ncbi:MAG: argininosuccinate lyase [Saprospiraceae bacterium]|nr:argininosuccinate lyase [Saprospiraceae bacterium]